MKRFISFALVLVMLCISVPILAFASGDEWLIKSETHEKSDETTSTTTYTYDNDGNMLTKQIESPDGMSEKYTYTYDGSDRMISLNYETSKGDAYGYVYTYTYDDDENTVIRYEEHPTRWDRTTYIYDENGNILTSLYEGSGCRSWVKKTYTYTYDDKGNILTEHREDSDGYEVMYNYTYDESGNILVLY